MGNRLPRRLRTLLVFHFAPQRVCVVHRFDRHQLEIPGTKDHRGEFDHTGRFQPSLLGFLHPTLRNRAAVFRFQLAIRGKKRAG